MSLSNAAIVFRELLKDRPEMFNVKYTADYLGIPVSTIRRWRQEITNESIERHDPPSKTLTGGHFLDTGERFESKPAKRGKKQQPKTPTSERLRPPVSETAAQNIKGGIEGGSLDSSSARAPSAKKSSGKPRFDGELPLDWPDSVREEWADFVAMREEKRMPVTPTAGKRLINKFKGWSHQRIAASLAHSTESNYTGVFDQGESVTRNGTPQLARSASPLKDMFYGKTNPDRCVTVDAEENLKPNLRLQQ